MIMITKKQNYQDKEFEWITIQEATNIAKQKESIRLSEADIYRHALHGKINLSIYFQSSVILRKINTTNTKVRLQPIADSVINQLCTLEQSCFANKRNLIVSTAGSYIYPVQCIIDTTLIGYEYFLVQRLLARSLKIPQPVIRDDCVNYGLSVSLHGDIFQVFESTTWTERIKKQLLKLPEEIATDFREQVATPYQIANGCCQRGYFPIHDLPQDACFVIRRAELEKLLNQPAKIDIHQQSPTRISTPLSRLFWLACKHNDAICPLIRQPYKLLSIFEQWASAEGITDKLSGDTLKTALERGSPASISAKN